MSQSTLVGAVPDSNGATFLTNLNATEQAIVTWSSGSTAPTTTYGLQWWADTSTLLSPTMKLRNVANSAWVNSGLRMDQPNLGLQDPFGWDPGTSSGLIFGYKTGVVLNSSQVPTVIAAGTTTLGASVTSYVERTTDGTVSSNTTGWTAGRVPLALVVTSGAAITAVTDYRGASVPATALVVHRELVAYYETQIATTDKQPVVRVPVPRTLQSLYYYKNNAVANGGTTTILLQKNGATAYTWTFSSALANQTMTLITNTPISFAAGDVISWSVSAAGTTLTDLSITADFTENPR
jgi:hypothetical protein